MYFEKIELCAQNSFTIINSISPTKIKVITSPNLVHDAY